MLFLLTKPHGDSLPGPEQYLKARNFAQGVLQRIYMPIEPLSGSEGPAGSEGRADLPHIALSEIYKLQSLYLTTGALAMEAGRPEVALVDYARGVEVILRFTRAVTSPATSGGPAGTTAFHSFRELFNAINIHVQFTHLKSSAHPDAFMKYQAALLQATEGVYDLERIGKETLEYVGLLRLLPGLLHADRLYAFQMPGTLSKAVEPPGHTFCKPRIYASFTFTDGEEMTLGQEVY
jgi:hypothetical protein